LRWKGCSREEFRPEEIVRADIEDWALYLFEEAIDNSMDIIKRQLEKAKAKFEK
jgi:ribosome-associated translation inhibitor RaiA